MGGALDMLSFRSLLTRHSSTGRLWELHKPDTHQHSDGIDHPTLSHPTHTHTHTQRHPTSSNTHLQPQAYNNNNNKTREKYTPLWARLTWIIEKPCPLQQCTCTCVCVHVHCVHVCVHKREKKVKAAHNAYGTDINPQRVIHHSLVDWHQLLFQSCPLWLKSYEKVNGVDVLNLTSLLLFNCSTYHVREHQGITWSKHH